MRDNNAIRKTGGGSRPVLAALYLFMVFFFMFSAATDGSGIDEKQYPLPRDEVESVLSAWLKGSGFLIDRAALAMGIIHITVQKKEASARIVLRPASPLATVVHVETLDLSPRDESFKEGLWKHLDAYSASLAAGATSSVPANEPAVIRNQGKSIVCIVAQGPHGEETFTGFIIDKKGLIVTTAHGLKEAKRLTVTLQDGREYEGDLIKADKERDLGLLRIEVTLDTYISLTAAKNMLQPEEMLYAVGCGNKSKTIIHSGRILDPPRRENNQPLWQVAMETLPGSSGSPVFDREGRLAAVVKGKFRGEVGTGFLIPFETLVAFLNRLELYEFRSIPNSQ